MTDDLEDIQARVEALSKKLRRVEDSHEQTEQELRERIDNLEAENRELRDRVDELEGRTDLLKLVDESDEMDAEQRRIVLLQHLHKEAKQRQRDGRKPKASLTRDQAERALQFPDLDRTTIYRDFERAVDEAGDESIVWYDSDGDQARLKINLEGAELPETIKRRNGGV